MEKVQGKDKKRESAKPTKKKSRRTVDKQTTKKKKKKKHVVQRRECDVDSSNDYFSELMPPEVTQCIFGWLTLEEICKSVMRVCRGFWEMTHPKQDKFWKEILLKDWAIISQKNTFLSSTLENLASIQWSIHERGWFRVGKTLWKQHKGKYDEWGIMTIRKDGSMYQGGIKKGKKDGRGKEDCLGEEYEGEFKDDQRSGRGKLTYKGSGDIYEGEFLNQKWGQGVYSWKRDGRVYNGQWQWDEMQGKGTMNYSDGGHYQGDWKAGKRHGKGTMKYADGTIYCGDWNKDYKERFNVKLLS